MRYQQNAVGATIIPYFFVTQINELGNPKAKKPDDVSPFYEVGLRMRVSICDVEVYHVNVCLCGGSVLCLCLL